MDAPLGSTGDGVGDGAAYSPLERCLTRLEALAGILPFCPAEHAAIYRSGCQSRSQSGLARQDCVSIK